MIATELPTYVAPKNRSPSEVRDCYTTFSKSGILFNRYVENNERRKISLAWLTKVTGRRQTFKFGPDQLPLFIGNIRLVSSSFRIHRDPLRCGESQIVQVLRPFRYRVSQIVSQRIRSLVSRRSLRGKAMLSSGAKELRLIAAFKSRLSFKVHWVAHLNRDSKSALGKTSSLPAPVALKICTSRDDARLRT